MCFFSFSFHSVFVGLVSARWFRVLMSPSLCSIGWWESISKCWSVCVGFLYTLLLRLLLQCVLHRPRRADCVLWHHPVSTWCYCIALSLLDLHDLSIYIEYRFSFLVSVHIMFHLHYGSTGLCLCWLARVYITPHIVSFGRSGMLS